MMNEQGIVVKSTRKIKAFSVFLILCVCPFALGDIVYLKSGGEIEGNVKHYKDSKFVVEFSSGGKTAIASGQVQTVKFSEPSSKTVTSEDTLTLRKSDGSTYALKGRIKSYEDNKFAVMSNLGEEISFSIGQVQAIEFKKVKKEKSQKTTERLEQQAPSRKTETRRKPTNYRTFAQSGTFACRFSDYSWGMTIEEAQSRLPQKGKIFRRLKQNDYGKYLSYNDMLFEIPCTITLAFTPITNQLASVSIDLKATRDDNFSKAKAMLVALTKKYGSYKEDMSFRYIWGDSRSGKGDKLVFDITMGCLHYESLRFREIMGKQAAEAIERRAKGKDASKL